MCTARWSNGTRAFADGDTAALPSSISQGFSGVFVACSCCSALIVGQIVIGMTALDRSNAIVTPQRSDDFQLFAPDHLL